MDNLIKGLQILNKYAGCEIAAEHDIIYVGLSDAVGVSKKDAKELEELGFFISDEYDSWAKFV